MFTFQALKLYLHKKKTQKLLNQLQFHHKPPYLAEARYPQLDFKTGAIVSDNLSSSCSRERNRNTSETSLHET